MNKKLLPLLGLILLSGACLLLAQGKTSTSKTETMDKNGHVLTARWAEYEKMQKADRPQKVAEILLDIREEAMQRHLPADFYDAGTDYIRASIRRNWKLMDSLRGEFNTLVSRFNEPIVTYTWMGEFAGKSTEERWEYVRSLGDAFPKGHHPEFYRNLWPYLHGTIKEFVSQDREYVLWDLLDERQMSFEEPQKDEVYTLLKQEVGERYPNWPALRYYVVSRLP